jgi:chromosome segregation ATPase
VNCVDADVVIFPLTPSCSHTPQPHHTTPHHTISPRTVEARKAALSAASAAAASASLSTHAQLLQTAAAQAEQLQGHVLPDLSRRVEACEAREEANARAMAEGRAAVERAQAMLTEHRSEGQRLLQHVRKVEGQLAETAAAKGELEGEMAALKARVTSLEEAVRQRDASLHDLRTQTRELGGQLEKVCMRMQDWSGGIGASSYRLASLPHVSRLTAYTQPHACMLAHMHTHMHTHRRRPRCGPRTMRSLGWSGSCKRRAPGRWS